MRFTKVQFPGIAYGPSYPDLGHGVVSAETTSTRLVSLDVQRGSSDGSQVIAQMRIELTPSVARALGHTLIDMFEDCQEER